MTGLESLQLTDPSLFKQQCLIDGIWCNADSGQSLEIVDPATNEVIGHAPLMREAETLRAIDAANRAWPGWRGLTGHVRSQRLRRWFELIVEHATDLAAILTAEQGKPLREAEGEIRYAAAFVEWYAEQAKRVDGTVISSPFADKRLIALKQPVGVCAAITPWNFPAAMITRKVAPALAAGCTMIVKPAELTPLTAFALGELSVRAGIPAGVLQFVTGQAAAIGKVLTSHPIVRKLSFTGSTAVGRILAAQCAPTVKRISLELGGQAPFIVFEDADIPAAVEGAVASKYRNSGQTCICSNRLYVQSEIYDQFAARLIEKVKNLNVGAGCESAADVGPLINDQAVEKVQLHVRDAVDQGAKVLCGGKVHSRGGNFFEPTILVDVDDSMLVTQEETFGPVAPLIRFHDESEVIRRANDTEFGLAAYLYTRDHSRAWRVSEALEYGMVGVNTGIISTEVAPFGGVKQSGVGREGAQIGIDEYLEVKYICQSIG